MHVCYISFCSVCGLCSNPQAVPSPSVPAVTLMRLPFFKIRLPIRGELCQRLPNPQTGSSAQILSLRWTANPRSSISYPAPGTLPLRWIIHSGSSLSEGVRKKTTRDDRCVNFVVASDLHEKLVVFRAQTWGSNEQSRSSLYMRMEDENSEGCNNFRCRCAPNPFHVVLREPTN